MVKSDLSGEVVKLEERIRGEGIPADLEERLLDRLSRLAKYPDLPSFVEEIDGLGNYVDWVVSLPWRKRSDDKLDLEEAK